MTSLTQAEAISKYEYSEELVSLNTHEPTSGDGYKRTLAYREWRNRAAAAIFDAGYEDESVDFLRCAEFPVTPISPDMAVLPVMAETVWVCDHDNRHDAMLFFATCGSRGCPDCAHRQVARFARRYIPAVLDCTVNKGANRLRHIVLTTPISLADENVKQKVSDYWNALGKLWSRLTSMSENYTSKGSIEAFEFGENGHKLHFHIVHYGRYLPQKAISEAWHDLTGGEAVVTYVRGIGAADDATDDQIANEVIEILKYSIKFWSTDPSGNVKYIEPELMPSLLAALKGKRRVRSRGIFYNIQAPEREPLACATCGNEMLRVGTMFFPIWQATGFSPAEYKIALGDDKLHSILANKSENEGGKGNKSPPVQRQLWDDLDVSEHPGLPHNELSKNRKAF